MSEKEDKQIEFDFATAKADFKPEFGNQKHIDLIKDFDRISKMEKELSAKIAASKGSQTLKAELLRAKRNFVAALKGK